jgi:tetratricopeptide (TPR) repeat protein
MNWEWDWAGVLHELHRAIELNPNHETAHRWLSAFLAGIGRRDEAMPIAERAVLLDPMSVLPHMNLGIINYLSGDLPAAEAKFRRVLEMQPGFLRGYTFLGSALSLEGRHDDAVRTLERLVERGNHAPIYTWTLGVAYALAGRLEEAHVILDSINHSSFPAIYRAMAHEALGERAAVVPTLERGLVERSDWMYSLGTQPLLRSLKGDPEFEVVVAKLGLP